MSMQGLTYSQLRLAVLSRLAAAAAVTAVVPANRQYDGRTLPLPDTFTGSALIVYIDGDNMTFAGAGYSGASDLPIMTGSTTVAIEYYATASSDAAMESGLDFSETILTTLLSDPTFTRLFDRIDSVQVSRDSSASGSKRMGVARLALSVTHRRAWG